MDSRLGFYAAGAGAGALTSMLDLIKDPDQGTIARVGQVLKMQVFSGSTFVFGAAFWAILLIIAVSLFVCWVFEVTSRLDGFLRGCTILAAFSIGAPSPIINKQVADGGLGSQAVAQASTLPSFVASAHAQSPDTVSSATGEVYIVLDNLRTMTPRPNSTITVQDAATHTRVALFSIPDNTARISQLYGKYVVLVATPGFGEITFPITIDKPLAAYSVSAPPSNLYAAVQKLLTPTEVTPKPDQAEVFKALGRKARQINDFAGAVINYQKSLELDPDDGLTHDYLGYALFRLGKLDEAVAQFKIAIAKRPDYKFAPINLTKAECAQGKLDDAKQTFAAVEKETRLWKGDPEFARVCASIVPHP